MRNKFDMQLSELNAELIEMGAMIETAIENACKALLDRDPALAHKTMDGDPDVDKKERDIESLCLKLLMQQQPVAGDLRLISSAMKMITDMERIGDQAADISEIVTFLSLQPYDGGPMQFADMAAATMKMVRNSIDAFVMRDPAAARAVIQADDVVDRLFCSIKDELIARIGQDPRFGSEALDLLMIAKYFERIGDHATNIAEWVEFSVTGILKGEKLQ
jgi:phosphate transport system protein